MAEAALVTQSAEPGPTSFALECLVMIGRRYGQHLTVDQLVKDNRLASADVPTDQLVLCAERAGFRCRALRATWATLANMQGALPAIVRLTDGRHAILLRVNHHDGLSQVVLQQPRVGGEPLASTLDRAAFEGLWSGDVLLVKRSLDMSEKARPFALGTVVAMVLDNRRLVRDLGVSVVALSVLALVPIIFAQLLLDRVLSYPARGTFLFLCLGFLIFVLFEGVFVALRRSLLGRLAARLEHDLSGLAFERLLHLPVDYFERTPLGLITRQVAQVSVVAGALGGRFVRTISDGGIAVLAVALLTAYNLPLAVAVGLFCLVLLGWTLFMVKRIRFHGDAIDRVEAERSAFVSESIAAFGTIKEFSLDARQRQRWDVLTARVTRIRMAESRATNLLQTMATPLEWLMVFGTFAASIVMADNQTGTAQIGILFACLLLTLRLAAPVRHLSTLVRESDHYRRAVDNLGILMNEPVEGGHAGHGVRLPLRGRIEFSNVTFSYPATPTPALQAVTFEVPAGTTLGIMGRSGSGKSTIARLLQKFHADYQGLIKFDGIDARDFEMSHLRSSLGVVLQDTFLFGGTVRDNITAAKPDATEEELAQAVRIAGADEFIERLPLGYDTILQEGGSNLSDGQRQRIAIARAVIADPRVLILDEATSALDPESEAIVNANLKRFASGRTTIAISHRFSALTNADMILVLDRGEVQDMGQHEELLERCDVYSGLWQRRKTLLEGPSEPETLLPRGSHVA